jgi:hypothetical protein
MAQSSAAIIDRGTPGPLAAVLWIIRRDALSDPAHGRGTERTHARVYGWTVGEPGEGQLLLGRTALRWF